MNATSRIAESHSKTMDRMYRLQRHFYDVSRRYYLLGRDRMLDELQATPGQNILEVGCGTGRNLASAARRYPLCALFGFDISSEMLRSAKASLQGSNVVLAQADATHFDGQSLFGHPQFDRIYFSYTLSMVPQWEAAIGQALRHLAPLGQLHIVDFGQSEKWPRIFKAMLFKWLYLFQVTPRADLYQVIKKLVQPHNLTIKTTEQFGGYVLHAVIHRND